LGTGVVVRELNADLAGIFPFAFETVPDVALTPSRNHHIVQVCPGLPNKFGFLVVVEYRDLQGVVVGRLEYGEAELFVPARPVS
jgi:hypothetical protein